MLVVCDILIKGTKYAIYNIIVYYTYIFFFVLSGNNYDSTSKHISIAQNKAIRYYIVKKI